MNLKFIYLFLSIFTLFNISYALIPVSDCNTFGTSDEYYNLTQNVNSSSSCFTFSNVINSTFNCNGYNVTGNYSGRGFEYVLNSENITIINCNVYNFFRGIFLIGENSSLINSSFINNSDTGVYISGNNNIIFNISSYDNLGDGIFINGQNNNVSSIYTYNNNKSGVSTIEDSNEFVNIFSYQNIENGIYVFGNNNIYENIISYGNNIGFGIDRAANIQVSDSNFSNNNEASLSFYTNVLTDCSLTLNLVYGDNKPILFYNESVVIDGWNNNVSEIILCNADNSIINDLTISSPNSGQGSLLQLIATDNTLFSNIVLRNGFYGLKLYFSSNNSIFSSNIYDNSEVGVLFLGNGALRNILLNNTFTNEENIVFISHTQENVWNTSSYGNTWLNSSGFGFSDTCLDLDEDGFCDSPYIISGSNIDSFPYVFTIPINSVSSLFPYGSLVLPSLLLFFFFLF
jgi:parallel beta-helix repeat protein